MATKGNGDPPVLDLQTMEELCQSSLNGRGGPIAPIDIQGTNFGLENDMIQQVQNSFQFHGLPGDDANKHLDKFLHVTQSMKDMYDSWKSKMELYMLNRQHGRMILESVENGTILWPTVEENGVTRSKKNSELSATEAIQADCDVKATNIILQGLPLETGLHEMAMAAFESQYI
nr:reverse transcriptase domain-containing protein [Tanacetum cinerariifolium]